MGAVVELLLQLGEGSAVGVVVAALVGVVVALGEGSWAYPGLGSGLRSCPVEVSPH